MDEDHQDPSSDEQKRLQNKSNVDWHEVWLAKRKRYRQNLKDAKNAFQTKEEYLNSDLYKRNQLKAEIKRKWKEIDMNEPDKFFSGPTIAFDLSYEPELPHQVRYMYHYLFYEPRSLPFSSSQKSLISIFRLCEHRI
jgi:hypothetical protein